MFKIIELQTMRTSQQNRFEDIRERSLQYGNSILIYIYIYKRELCAKVFARQFIESDDALRYLID